MTNLCRRLSLKFTGAVLEVFLRTVDVDGCLHDRRKAVTFTVTLQASVGLHLVRTGGQLTRLRAPTQGRACAEATLSQRATLRPLRGATARPGAGRSSAATSASLPHRAVLYLQQAC